MPGGLSCQDRRHKSKCLPRGVSCFNSIRPVKQSIGVCISGWDIPRSSRRCWKVVLKPRPDAPVVWGKLIYWVSTDYLPVEVEYYDEKDRLMRTIEYTDVKMLSGRRLPTKWTVVNKVKDGHRTEFIMKDVQFDAKISERVFSLRELEKGY